SHMPSWLLEFSRLHPDIHIDLKDVNPDELMDEMAAGSCEVGIGPMRRRTPRVISHKWLFSSPILLVVGKHHPFAHRESVTWKEVAQQTLVLSSKRSLGQLCADTGQDFSQTPVVELSQLHSML